MIVRCGIELPYMLSPRMIFFFVTTAP